MAPPFSCMLFKSLAALVDFGGLPRWGCWFARYVESACMR
jgi:hypothetical protein